jgi:Ca-activated chloride channel family protein
MVLLADGVNDAGPSPLDAAQTAADRGVRVYTIGVGTKAAGPVSCQSSDPTEFGGTPSSESPNSSRGIDEATLKRIAAITGGAYYPASNADELRDVLLHLPTRLSYRQVTYDATVVFVGWGLLFALSGIALSLTWHPS